MEKNIVKLETYEVKVEAMVPCQLVYRVSAASPEEAVKKIDKMAAIKFHPHMSRKKMINAVVYNAGTINVRGNFNLRKY